MKLLTILFFLIFAQSTFAQDCSLTCSDECDRFFFRYLSECRNFNRSSQIEPKLACLIGDQRSYYVVEVNSGTTLSKTGKNFEDCKEQLNTRRGDFVCVTGPFGYFLIANARTGKLLTSNEVTRYECITQLEGL